jgi:hypothetical protein
MFRTSGEVELARTSYHKPSLALLLPEQGERKKASGELTVH